MPQKYLKPVLVNGIDFDEREESEDKDGHRLKIKSGSWPVKLISLCATK